MRIAGEEGRATRPDLKLGVCGEHGGDPDSVHFFHEVGLDYVSCSPFRVPVARLEAGRAVVLEKRRGQRQQVREHPGYDSHATARWVAEPPKRAQAFQRGPFVRDRARVLHSSALRRLAAKTQVVEVGAGDFPRTRLTHSLECAQIGRELGEALGCDPDLVDAACLAHDLGHPPFGHNGEIVLADLAAGCGGFEGNAQSLRLLTRLEAKVPGAGLNLARATLDATIKYPWPAGPGTAPRPDGAAATQFPPPGLPGEEALPAPQKFGYYADDGEVFAWIRDGAPPGRTCLEAQVMDWADDVAYSVHDLEDGLHAGHITLPGLHDRSQQEAVAGMTATYYCPPGSADVAELSEVLDDLLAPALLAGALRRRPGQPGGVEAPDQRADRAVLPRGAGGDAGGQRGHRAGRAGSPATTPTWWCPGGSGWSARCSRASPRTT